MWAALSLGLLPRQVAQFEFRDAAVASAIPADRRSEVGFDLLLTRFSPGAGDAVAGVRLPGNTSVLDAEVVWPNQAELAPRGAVPGGAFALVAGGFFVSPSKATGSVSLVPLPGHGGGQHTISTPKRGFFYHVAKWHDINGDGRLDVVAARAMVPENPFGHREGELIWLEQPSSGALQQPWREHTLVSPAGPDVAFALADLDGDGTLEVVGGNTFDGPPALSIFSCGAPAGWANCSGAVRRTVVDAGLSRVFNIAVEDLDADGQLDLLVTNNRADGHGAVYAYARGSQGWQRHTLAEGFRVKRSILPGQGGPGAVVPLHPSGGGAKGPPTLLVSGDDNGTVSLMTPRHGETFAYTLERLCQGTGTVGTPAVLYGDGGTTLVVPMYHDGRVVVFQYP